MEIEFGIVQASFYGQGKIIDRPNVGMVAVLNAADVASGETLEFDAEHGCVAHRDDDDEEVELLDSGMSVVVLGSDQTPSFPASGDRLAFERGATVRGQMAGRWALAAQWREQVARIGEVPYSLDEEER